MAFFVLSAMPSHYHHPRGGAFIHIFAISLFLPVAGPLLFLSLIVVAMVFPRADSPADSYWVEAPKFVTYLASRVKHGAGARLRARLDNHEGASDDRVAAMVAMRTLPPHITGGMLRDLLSDPDEEIRLLAYGVVDNAEKKIMQQIFMAQEQMPEAVTITEQADINARLAELYWELIYQNLVQGEVYNYTLERVEHYAREAVTQNDTLASMYYLLGRCALLRNKPNEAKEYLQRALFNQFPVERLLPWLGEVAFLQHDYSRLGEILRPLDNGTLSPTLQSTVNYWSK
ncbi:tetratricopeptide repeat protein [Eoetvoesiella caeni]|nr:hypothetical protein [Eoetvoesiella caeni]MCI2810885.1 hypothetical protein [Eoetvoesiella caeni]NYT56816.1 hypothetical protein [Eoetvoesiella caeni]